MLYRIFTFIFICLLLSPESWAAKRRHRSHAPAIDKYAAIVIDGKTGQVLYTHRAEKLCYPASLSKMMTLYLVFRAVEQGRLHFNDRLCVSHLAAKQKPCKLGLCVGDEISVRDAICGLTVKSSNDAAVALAEHIAGSQERFARMMTQEARRLGMKHTYFANATGWHDVHQITTPRDMAILARALYYHYPNYYRYFSMKNFNFRGASYTNHNKLLGRVDGVDGVKTGFTNPAGYNLAASAVRQGNHVIAVVMGGETHHWRNRRTTELLNQGFQLIDQNKPQLRLANHFVDDASGPKQIQNHRHKQVQQRVHSIFNSLERQGVLQEVQAVRHECQDPAPVVVPKALYKRKGRHKSHRAVAHKSRRLGSQSVTRTALAPERLRRRALGV